jgi:hypothetical protein
MRMKRGVWLHLTVAALIALVGGCFENERTLVVNGDGSATLTDRTVYTKQGTDMIKSMAAMAQQDPNATGGKIEMADPLKQEIDPNTTAAHAKGMGEGVTVKSAKLLNLDDGRQGIEVIYAVADVNKLKLPLGSDEAKQSEEAAAVPSAPSATKGSSTQASSDANAAASAPASKAKYVTMKFTKAAAARPAKLSITMPPSAQSQPASGPSSMPASAPASRPKEEMQQMAQMAPFLAGMRVAIVVKVNGKVSANTASYPLADKTGLTLMDIHVGDMLADPNAFKKLGTLPEELDYQKTKEAMKDEDLKKYIKMETSPKVDVEFQ